MLATYKVEERDTDVATAIFATPTELGSLRVMLLAVLLFVRAMTPLTDRWKAYVWEIVELAFGLLVGTSFCVESGNTMPYRFIILTETVYCLAATLTLAASVFSRECVPCLCCILIHFAVVPRIRFPLKSFLVMLYLHGILMVNQVSAIMVSPYFEYIRIETFEDFWNLVIFLLHRTWFIGEGNKSETYYIYKIMTGCSLVVWASCQLKNIIEAYFTPSKECIDEFEKESHRWGSFGRWTSLYEA